jgi:hypothetical protein
MERVCVEVGCVAVPGLLLRYRSTQRSTRSRASTSARSNDLLATEGERDSTSTSCRRRTATSSSKPCVMGRLRPSFRRCRRGSHRWRTRPQQPPSSNPHRTSRTDAAATRGPTRTGPRFFVFALLMRRVDCASRQNVTRLARMAYPRGASVLPRCGRFAIV